MVEILDVLVPQVVDQLVASLKHLDKPIPEQVNAVSKISSSSRCFRTLLLEPQMEVPTDLSFSSLQQQTASRSSTFQFLALVVIVEVFKGFLPVQNSTAPVSQQIVDIPVRGGGLEGFFAQDRFQPHQPHCLALQMRRLKGFFSHFSPISKKCAVRWAHSSSAACARRVLVEGGGGGPRPLD